MNGTFLMSEAVAHAVTLLRTSTRNTYVRPDGDGAKWDLPFGASVRLGIGADLYRDSSQTGVVGLRLTLSVSGSATGFHVAAHASAFADALAEAARVAALIESDLACYIIRAGSRRDPTGEVWERSATMNDHHRVSCPVWDGQKGCACGGQKQWQEVQEAKRAGRPPRDLTQREAPAQAVICVAHASDPDGRAHCGAPLDRGDSVVIGSHDDAGHISESVTCGDCRRRIARSKPNPKINKVPR